MRYYLLFLWVFIPGFILAQDLSLYRKKNLLTAVLYFVIGFSTLKIITLLKNIPACCFYMVQGKEAVIMKSS